VRTTPYTKVVRKVSFPIFSHEKKLCFAITNSPLESLDFKLFLCVVVVDFDALLHPVHHLFDALIIEVSRQAKKVVIGEWIAVAE